VLDKDGHVEQHPHRNEKEAREYVLEGQDVLKDVEAVFRAGKQEPGEKGPQGEGQAERSRAERDGETQAEHGHEHQFLAARAQDELHDAGHDVPGEHPAAAEDGQRAPCGKEHVRHVRFPVSGEDRDREHHGHHGDVLKDEHRKGQPALRGFGLRLLLQAAEHDGR